MRQQPQVASGSGTTVSASSRRHRPCVFRQRHANRGDKERRDVRSNARKPWIVKDDDRNSGSSSSSSRNSHENNSSTSLSHGIASSLAAASMLLQTFSIQHLGGMSAAAMVASFGSLAMISPPSAEAARNLASVNRPDLLPEGDTNVIDAAGFLTDGEESRLQKELSSLEKDTGYKVRVLAQIYPATPGLAIKEYWSVDDRTVVFVADPSFGNILNFNVGQEIDLDVPRTFWTKLSSRYGTTFYWKDNGEGASILNTVAAIDSCFREEPGTKKCTTILNADEYNSKQEANSANSLFSKLFK